MKHFVIRIYKGHDSDIKLIDTIFVEKDDADLLNDIVTEYDDDPYTVIISLK